MKTQTVPQQKVFHIRCYTKKELTEQLGFKSTKQFDTALKSFEDQNKIKKLGWYYSPLQVEVIIKHVGFDRIRNN